MHILANEKNKKLMELSVQCKKLEKGQIRENYKD